MIVNEDKTSRAGQDSWEGSSTKLVYNVQLQDGETEATIRAYFLANTEAEWTPTGDGQDSITVSTLIRGPIALTPIEAGIFKVEVNYIQPKPTQWSISAGSGTTKLQYSRRTMRSFDATGRQATVSPNFKQGINVTKDAIDGVDVPTPQPSIKITKSYDASEIDGDYIRLLLDFSGKPNSAAYTLTIGDVDVEFLAKELRLGDVTLQTTENNRIEITYPFEVSFSIVPGQPDTHRTIGTGDGAITINDKEGWDYLWLHSEEGREAGYFTRTAKTAYIEEIFETRDYGELLL